VLASRTCQWLPCLHEPNVAGSLSRGIWIGCHASPWSSAPGPLTVPVPAQQSGCWQRQRGGAARGGVPRRRSSVGRLPRSCHPATPAAAACCGRARPAGATTVAAGGDRLRPARQLQCEQAGPQQLREPPMRPGALASGQPRPDTSCPRWGRRSSQSATALICARLTSRRRNASTSLCLPGPPARCPAAAGASAAGQASRPSPAGHPSAPARRWGPIRRARAAPTAVTKPAISASIGSRARSILRARAISSSQSSGPSNPSRTRIGAVPADLAPGSPNRSPPGRSG